MFTGIRKLSSAMGHVVVHRLQNTGAAVFVSDHELAENDIGLMRYRPCSLSKMAAESGFSAQQLKILYQGFKQECPNGLMTESTLRAILTQLFPFGDCSAYSKNLWRVVSPDNQSVINFEEFLKCLSVLLLGTADQKLAWIFDLYDLDQDGFIGVNDLGRTIEGVHGLMNTHGAGSGKQEPFDAALRRSLLKLDADRDGRISREDFFSMMSTKENIELLETFNESLITIGNI